MSNATQRLKKVEETIKGGSEKMIIILRYGDETEGWINYPYDAEVAEIDGEWRHKDGSPIVGERMFVILNPRLKRSSS